MIRLFRGLLEVATGITPRIKARFNDESTCLRCGKCCNCGIQVQDRMVMLKDLPCRHLDYEPGGMAVCVVYPVRENTGWCHKINVESIRKNLFPPNCPYVEGLDNYRGKIELADSEFEEVVPILRKIFKGFPMPEYVKKSDWKKFIRQTLGLNSV